MFRDWCCLIPNQGSRCCAEDAVVDAKRRRRGKEKAPHGAGLRSSVKHGGRIFTPSLNANVRSLCLAAFA
jgi:hypothetical protein